MKSWIVVCAAFLLSTPVVSAREYVDLELVIATDVSRSIDSDEARLQREGIAAAFRSKQVIDAIRSGVLRRIAVAYIDYSSRDWNKLLIDWRIIRDRESAYGFADALLKAELTFGRRTSISDALEQAADLIDSNDIEGTRRVIDVSGDGPNNFGRYVDRVRDETTAKRITINGLPIINDSSNTFSRYNLPDLDNYYRGCVIGGPGAFLVVARDFKDFARAIRKKLVLEIAGLQPVRPKIFRNAGFIRAQIAPPQNVRPAPNGYTYEKGCDIGERMREGYWADDDT
tara:strand:- start:2952 stop:3806 length:855 start_codon:yes stop_codon:yes gene_type:complete